jgi:signal transduction histidine kinase
VTVAGILGSIPYFSDLSPETIDEVAEACELIEVPAGTVIIEEGSHSEEMYVVVSGEFVVTSGRLAGPTELARVGAGEIVGEGALLHQGPRLATVTSAVDSTVLRVPAATFDRLIDDRTVSRRMFHTVTTRLRDTEETLRHGERMAALGKMAAQLMHELNNPAAAVGRSSRELAHTQGLLAEVLAALGVTTPDLSVGARRELAPLQRARLEEEMASTLEEMGVDDPWTLSASLVGMGWAPDDLRRAVEAVDAGQAGNIVRLLGLLASAAQLVEEIGLGADRISELVRVVKEYSFLDRAPVQEIVVSSGIRDTLVLLRHKLDGLDVVVDLADDLARVEAPGRELTQVWTNLIDNAADAMEGSGTLTITAWNDSGNVVVTVSDTGGGISEENLARIFDPFFTTKEPGHGTGLGLHTVHSILSRMGATITVDSGSTGTTFTVTIPAV